VPPAACCTFTRCTDTITPVTKKWRVGVLGLGHWYSAFGLARGLREYPRAELVAAAWPNRDQLDQFARTFGVHACRDYGELLQRDDIDIVHLAAPVSQIPDLAVAAARAGKHMVLGKPMAMTIEQADRIVDAVESAGVTCFPFQGIMRLRHAELRTRIDRGEIGDIAVVHGVCRWSIAEDWYNSGTPGWFVDPEQVPGGAFIDEGIYWVDLFRWLTRSEIVQVDARMANLVHKELAVEDWGLATFTLANGVIATLEAAWTINSPRATGPSPKQNSVVRLEVVGTRGEIIDQWFRAPGRAVLAAGAADWVFERQSEPPSFAPPSPFPLSHLIDSLDGRSELAATVREARQSFAAAMAAYDAARSGRPVHLQAVSSR
jgi:predicted dehydrogenase